MIMMMIIIRKVMIKWHFLNSCEVEVAVCKIYITHSVHEQLIRAISQQKPH